MSWEQTDDWPDGRGDGGAFRSAAEVIVARREALTLGDRLRLWWHSTPDHPFGAIPRRVLLTPRWLYCDTRAGGRQRVGVDQLRGSRREAGRVIYAVADGEDLVLADRGGDALERALDEHAGAVAGEWRSPAAYSTVVIVSAIALAVALSAVALYRDEAVDEIQRGMTTSEAALGLYAALGGVLLVLLFLTFFPQRYVADSLGLTSVRGLFGWVRSTVPVERITGVIAGTFTTRNSRGRISTHHHVELRLRDPSEMRRIHHSGGTVGEGPSTKREVTRQIGRRVARLYGVDLHDRLD